MPAYSMLQRTPREERTRGGGFSSREKYQETRSFSALPRVAAVVIKLKKRYMLTIVKAYAPATSYSDETVDSFYKDVESAINKATTHFAIVLGDFNANVGKNQMGER